VKRPARPTLFTRRGFTGAVAAFGALASPLSAQQAPAAPQDPNAIPQNTANERQGTAPEVPPFQGTLAFARKSAPLKVRPFSLSDVRLLPGPFLDAQEWNHAYVRRLSADRLLHNFRVNAGLPSSAQPLGGWEEPKCELRGHFVGHYLSSCGLLYASTGDKEIKAVGDYLVAELAKCQAKLGAGGYLSAFPLELFDRLDARKRVWAPFYTIHKIMVGLLDMYQHCGNKQALETLQGMAHWTGQWTEGKTEEHLQSILNTEYGGMNDVLYNLAAATGDEHWVQIGDRFTKKKFFNPLALRRDELRGLHVNTHIPQVIGAARRYELSSDMRFHDVADFFWYEVVTARSYATGGTSNGEGWLTQPRHLAQELVRSEATAECCCAYNMLKLTRQLYTWTGDPRYFDYYERIMLNHRLGTIYPETGATMYYLSHTPGAWKTFGTENESFWCCTGTGVEEYAKLTDSIYFHDDEGVFVNLFIPSELNWAARGFRLRQETKFPEQPGTTLVVGADRPVQLTLRLRVPEWLAGRGSVTVNGKVLEVSAGPGGYLALTRTWANGDRIEMALPMDLRVAAMPDDPALQAVLYGPLVLAGDLGSQGLTKNMIVGPEGPEVERLPLEIPGFRTAGADPKQWIRPAGEPLTFRTTGQPRDITLAPLNRLFNKRYSVYWRVS
jgi:uncharacterized protein